MKELIDKLAAQNELSDKELLFLIENRAEADAEYLYKKAREACENVFGDEVYLRGLIEISSFCKNDCLYCGIRRSNKNASRYRLSKEEILACADEGYNLGFRTFVLQGGEDAYYTDDILCKIISELKERYPDCAVTLSLGERGKESFKRLFDAGADRYLLRHETADPVHYSRLHPAEMRLETRIRCLYDLKEIGYQVGCGFMVGSPFQTSESIVKDLRFIKDFEPQMVGIGPFISHHDTPFRNEENGSVQLTLYLLAIIRLLLPKVLLPATTALGTLDPTGREKGILAGANVVMPNLSPTAVRKKYMLYDNKICTGDESAQCRKCLEGRIMSTGRKIVTARGDAPGFKR